MTEAPKSRIATVGVGRALIAPDNDCHFHLIRASKLDACMSVLCCAK